MEHLEDIGWRRTAESSLKFTAKKFLPRNAQRDKTVFTSSDLRKIILSSPDVADFIKRFSDEQNISEARLLDEMKIFLSRMDFNIYTVVYRLFVLFLMPLAKLLVSGCYLSESELLKLRNEMGNNPLILLPTHRSFADAILICYLCFEYDIQMSIGVAGMDYSRCWCVSQLVKKGGGIFIRRSFKNDKLYSFVFKVFFQTLVKETARPLTFFLEGTRSKHGKFGLPKLGLLKLIVDLYITGQVTDITLAPFAMSYDSVMEDEIIAFDVFRRYRPKGILKNIAMKINMLIRPYGRFYINFSEPISLKRYVRQNSRFGISELTHVITSRLKRHLVLTCFNVLSLVMTNHLYSTDTNWLGFNRVVLKVRQLKYLLKRLGATVGFKDEEEMFEIKRVIVLHPKLLFIDENNCVRIRLSKERSLSKNFETDWISVMMLQYYTNYCLPFLINPAFIVAILSSHRSSVLPVGRLFSSYKLMRTMFEDEFAFYEGTEKSDFDESKALLEQMGCIVTRNSLTAILERSITDYANDGSYLVLFRCLLKPYLQGVHFICEYLYGNAGETYDRKRLVKRIQNYIERRIRHCDLKFFSVYTISSCFIENLLNSFAKADIITTDVRNGNCSYRCNDPEKVYDVINFIKSMDLECSIITNIPSDFPFSLSRY